MLRQDHGVVQITTFEIVESIFSAATCFAITSVEQAAGGDRE